MNYRKSQPYVALVYLLGILIVGFAFAVLLMPLRTVYDMNYVKEDAQDSDLQLFFVRSKTVFMWLPFLLILPTILWFLTKSNERHMSS